MRNLPVNLVEGLAGGGIRMRNLPVNLVEGLAGGALPGWRMSRLSCCRLLSPVSAQDPDAIIYDCRPPILPVSLRMKGLGQKNVVVSAVLPSLAAPSGEVGLQCVDSLPERDARPALMSEFSSDTGTELEDKRCHFQPLPESTHLRYFREHQMWGKSPWCRTVYRVVHTG